MKVFTTRTPTSTPLKGKKIAVIGYGSQGHAHALNLRDSGMRRRASACGATARRGRRPRAAGLRVVRHGDGGRVRPTSS